MKHYTITTLGCKVNQCESSALGSLLEASGYRNDPLAGRTDLIVINTCTVTGKAAMQSRQAIRQAIRNHPEARVVVTGCYAQTAPEEIRTIAGVACIVGHADKLGITQALEQAASASHGPAIMHRNVVETRCFDPLPSVAPDSRTRAFLKIQDGCNAFCTYCIVPHARGRSRSMPVEDVLTHLERLAEDRFKEAVLTGIHLGAYGKDLDPKVSLFDLLVMVSHRKLLRRIRLSSIEPTEVHTGIIGLAADPSSPLCSHFHIPLQSGDNGILKRMGRPYTREKFADTVNDIRHALPHAAIGVDVLVGFPGENDQAFDHTYALIQALDITYLHVFPFSPRKGTPAADFKNQVPERIVKQRCKRLRALGYEKKSAFYRSNINRVVDVLIESIDGLSGHSKGISENYLPVVLRKGKTKENSIQQVRIQSVEHDLTVVGSII